MDHDVSILINNAGIYLNKPFAETSADEIQRVIDTNLVVPILLTRVIWPTFVNRGGGLIVNINSLAGVNGGKGETAYSASKAGLAGFSNSLQYDGPKNNIRILNVFLGAMQTDMTKTRKDWDKFINPFTVAETIADLCKDYSTLRITEVTIARRQY
jgi:3-oxoacyl-[acyl-carrier protein] reductase